MHNDSSEISTKIHVEMTPQLLAAIQRSATETTLVARNLKGQRLSEVYSCVNINRKLSPYPILTLSGKQELMHHFCICNLQTFCTSSH